jgi:hypothetical protein
MRKQSILALLVAVLLPIGAAAQENATVILKSGEKLNAQLIDLGGVGFTLRVNGQERRVPKSEVAAIDFTGSDMTAADWDKATPGQSTVVLRSGETVNGNLHDISGKAPLKILFKTASGDRTWSSSEISRIVFAKPGNAVATSGSQVPSGEGVAVQGNQRWTPSGITVRQGETVSFSSTGEVRLSADSADVAHASGALSQRYPQGAAPLPRVFAGALIGRVGNGEPFPIGGPTNTVTMPASGQLFLGINDDDVNDNQGGFRVNIQRSGRRR